MFKIIAILSMFFSLPGCISQPSLLPPMQPLQESKVSGEGKQKILMIDISGMLTSVKPSGFVDQLLDRPSLPARVKEELTKAGKDEHIKAILLRINSPGGTVTASDILHHEILQFKEKHKIPIVASIVDLGTSGGYYLATVADQIIVHPSTITGSIGVIMIKLNAKGLLEKIGVEAGTISSGPKKSMGFPFRAMTNEEQAIFQSVIDSMYEQFVLAVKKGRPLLEEEKIRKVADGRILAADQALEAGLVDSIGYLDDAIERAKKAAGLEEATVVTYHRSGGYKNNIYSTVMAGNLDHQPFSSLHASALLALLNGGTPQFMYMWMP